MNVNNITHTLATALDMFLKSDPSDSEVMDFVIRFDGGETLYVFI